MGVAFTEVTKCMVVQRNHFKSYMENLNVTGLLKGNMALAHENRKMELKSTDQNKEVEGKEWCKEV